MVDRECHWKGSEGQGRDDGGKGGGGSRGHRVVGGRDDGLEPKGGGGRAWGEEYLGRKPVGGCYSAEMRRPAIRSTAHDPMREWVRDMSRRVENRGDGQMSWRRVYRWRDNWGQEGIARATGHERLWVKARLGD